MKSVFAGLVLFWTLCAAAQADEASLVPRPASDVPASGGFTVTEATPVQTYEKDAAAAEAAQRFLLLMQDGGPLVLKRGTGKEAIRFITDRAVEGEEAYRIKINSSGITVSASHPAGLFYGAVSLWQLLTAHPGEEGPVKLAARTIDDAPRFAWRGLMLDSSRHFQSVAYIKQFIDWMAELKLNVFHWHLTDDQGWRLEIKHYPKLTDIGAWSVPAGQAPAADIDYTTGKPRLSGGFYTQEQVRDIVAYAAARHITVLPEIEMPGHAAAAIAAYPELGTEPVPGGMPSHDWGVHYHLYNIDDSTFTFLETVLTEVMALFPSPYIHIGGDEAVKDEWKASPKIQARMKELGVGTEDELQAWFVRRIEAFLEQHDRRLVGWDEILQGGIAPHATVMSWRGIDGAVAAARSGHDTILSPAPTLYFDNRQGGSPNEPPGRGKIISLQDVYGFDPTPSALTAEEAKHVLGVQANLWTEQVRTEDQATRMTYPRAAALAEIAWTPHDRIDWQDFEPRLAVERARYARAGLQDDQPAPKDYPGRTYSQELKMCPSSGHPLSLEDDAPLNGPRRVYLVDIIDPCWQLPQADLTAATTLKVTVGQIPNNFQFGGETVEYHPAPAHTPDGELEVRADGCDGAPIAVLPLAPAVNNVTTTLLSAPLPARAGKHDLCFRFTAKTRDPLWVIDWIALEPKP
jgi:hexosaminidase